MAGRVRAGLFGGLAMTAGAGISYFSGLLTKTGTPLSSVIDNSITNDSLLDISTPNASFVDILVEAPYYAYPIGPELPRVMDMTNNSLNTSFTESNVIDFIVSTPLKRNLASFTESNVTNFIISTPSTHHLPAFNFQNLLLVFLAVTISGLIFGQILYVLIEHLIPRLMTLEAQFEVALDKSIRFMGTKVVQPLIDRWLPLTMRDALQAISTDAYRWQNNQPGFNMIGWPVYPVSFCFSAINHLGMQSALNFEVTRLSLMVLVGTLCIGADIWNLSIASLPLHGFYVLLLLLLWLIDYGVDATPDEPETGDVTIQTAKLSFNVPSTENEQFADGQGDTISSATKNDDAIFEMNDSSFDVLPAENKQSADGKDDIISAATENDDAIDKIDNSPFNFPSTENKNSADDHVDTISSEPKDNGSFFSKDNPFTNAAILEKMNSADGIFGTSLSKPKIGEAIFKSGDIIFNVPNQENAQSAVGPAGPPDTSFGFGPTGFAGFGVGGTAVGGDYPPFSPEHAVETPLCKFDSGNNDKKPERKILPAKSNYNDRGTRGRGRATKKQNAGGSSD